MSRKHKHEHVNHERWLVSYADFITLLFAFFVVLFASSQSDKKKQTQLAVAMQSAFSNMGIFEQHSKQPPLTALANAPSSEANRPFALPETRPSSITAPVLGKQHQEAQRRLTSMLADQAFHNHLPPGSVAVHATREGLVVSLREGGFFASGSAEVSARSLPLLLHLASALPANPVRVEGHTDNMPIHTAQFATNWELSTARAAAIARFLLEHAQVKAEDLSAAGYAEFHPIASNDTEEGRAQNRRVDIILLSPQVP